VLPTSLITTCIGGERLRLDPELFHHKFDHMARNLCGAAIRGERLPGKAQTAELHGEAEPVLLPPFADEHGAIRVGKGVVAHQVAFFLWESPQTDALRRG
jgi:hypothetical protein